MQSSLVGTLTETFLDDAKEVATGTLRIAADLVLDGLRAMKDAAFAPVDRMARACDVAGVLDRHGPATAPGRRLTRAETMAARRRCEKGGLFAAFRALRHLS